MWATLCARFGGGGGGREAFIQWVWDRGWRLGEAGVSAVWAILTGGDGTKPPAITFTADDMCRFVDRYLEGAKMGDRWGELALRLHRGGQGGAPSNRWR